jgi:hypothetical protein
MADALFDYVKLLLKFEGANNSQVIVDSSRYARDISAFSSAKISTTHVISGSSSGWTDGGDDLFTLGGQAFNFVSKELCIEFYFNTTASTSYATLMTHERYAGIGGSSWIILINNGASDGKIAWWFSPYNTGAAMLASPSGGYNDGNDHHVAITRKHVSGASYRWDLWIDGVSVANITDSSDFGLDALHGSITIGGDPVYGRPVGGYWDLVRITSGHYRYDSSFTPASDFDDYARQITGDITESVAITRWQVVANRISDGAFMGRAESTGTTYTLNCKTLELVIMYCAPAIDGEWAANTAIALDYIVVATDPESTPHLWICTTAGTTDASEPTWNLSGTTTSGSAVFTYIGPLENPICLGPK